MNLKTILVTGIGGPTPRSIAKTIRKKNPAIRLVGMDINPKAYGFFMSGLLDKSYLAPRVNHPDYWPFVKKLIKDEKIDIAFVQPELEVIGWGEYYKEYGVYPCPVLIPPLELSKILMNKARMADILAGTEFIPETVTVTQEDSKFDEVEKKIGFPCWIRASTGSGGLGALKLDNMDSYRSWLFMHRAIHEFTVSTFLSGRHLATQMLYLNGEYIKGAALECVEYIMASIAPSKVTGNTSYGRFLNENRILEFCDNCVASISKKLNIPAHGVLSFDLKEDHAGNLKVTEINIRHMAYTGVMANVGLDLVQDTIQFLASSDPAVVSRNPYFQYERPYAFLRDVDIEPIIVNDDVFKNGVGGRL